LRKGLVRAVGQNERIIKNGVIVGVIFLALVAVILWFR